MPNFAFLTMPNSSPDKVSKPYPEFKELGLPEFEGTILDFWIKESIFEKSVENRSGSPSFTFYEGPPSANGFPGIHHVLSRSLKDIFCRYKTLKGFKVNRKGGWDTHGLPVELQVEKSLGITKDDIGKKISVAEYNQACKTDVLKFKDTWDTLTRRMGYWVDLNNPYITFETNYIESLWSILKKLFEKGYLYKGYSIQPYSPAAGTALSSHELNLPGCYRNVKDTSAVAQFRIKQTSKSEFLFSYCTSDQIFILAWTTTPWTLPSNAALAVHKAIEYSLVETYNRFSKQKIFVILASALLNKHFYSPADVSKTDNQSQGFGLDDLKNLIPIQDEHIKKNQIPWKIVQSFKGQQLLGITYHQLLDYVTPEDPAFTVIEGDFVTTEDGTGIVHIAPTFGADDMRVAKSAGIPSILVSEEGKMVPLVDKHGKFVAEVSDFAGEYVKEEYLQTDEKTRETQRQKNPESHNPLSDLISSIVTRTNEYLGVDDRIVLKLQLENKLFNKEKYEHSYPHCWRTDKPVLYYPMDSWFIKTTAVKDRMVELNKTINWKPESTGTGRFGNWLENLVDWNLSRSRFWGTPLPVWISPISGETKCIGSVSELELEIEKSISQGFMQREWLSTWSKNQDLHRPFVDEIILSDSLGNPMYRESELVDVWFDSGAMPYAQWHYPFENQTQFDESFPADFIAEGVDQTRGWFFTLHAIAVLTQDSVAYKNVIANGLVLDKDGNKMSKRLGNTVDPFKTIEQFGADATRWYMIENTAPWENLKFNLDSLAETQRRFFGTLFNTYSFYVLYANIDGFISENQTFNTRINRPELDKWIISALEALRQETDSYYSQYEPTKAARAIQEFAVEQLSNWYVRLARRRFWIGELTEDKISAYETLHFCLNSIAQMMSPIAPFFSDWLYRNLNATNISNGKLPVSVHLTNWNKADESALNEDINAAMEAAQEICSLVRSIRRKVDIKIRQPLSRIVIPAFDQVLADRIKSVEPLVLSEVNVKSLVIVGDETGLVKKKLKPNFKTLGPKAGPKLKSIAALIQEMSPEQIRVIEKNGFLEIFPEGNSFLLNLEDVEIISEDLSGMSSATNGRILVALDISISESLRQEGLAREFVNRIQNFRKESGFEVTDRISVVITAHENWNEAVKQLHEYICTETLCDSLRMDAFLEDGFETEIYEVPCRIKLEKKKNG